MKFISNGKVVLEITEEGDWRPEFLWQDIPVLPPFHSIVSEEPRVLVKDQEKPLVEIEEATDEGEGE